MRIYYANDTWFHAGTDAINTAIYHILRNQGHEIIGSCQRPNGPDPELLKKCDALVVNGEGTFRDEAKMWEPGRQQRLISGMAHAKILGMRVHFINALWCNMQSSWGWMFSALDQVAVREIASQREMSATQGVNPEIFPDMSYYCPIINDEPLFSAKGKILVGTIYPYNFRDSLAENHPIFTKYEKLPITPYNAPTARMLPAWSQIIRTLSGADLYITGQHHGIYAAIKAKVPFVYCRCNTHKVTGLFEWAGVDIPEVRCARDIKPAIEWAFANRGIYDRLFDFVESRPAWQGIAS